MGRKLRLLVGAVKDTASVTKATLLSSSTSSYAAAADLAVLRATAHHPPSSPPHPRHIAALLLFGDGARPAATALAASLSARLLSTRDSSVALKSLLCLHLLLRSAPFILLDQLTFSLYARHGRRSPLLLSSFPLGSDPLSWSLSSCVRWYSRLLELLLLLPAPFPAAFATGNCDHHLSEWVSSLLNGDLVSEIESLEKLVHEASLPPEMPAAAGNRLVAEVVRLVGEDRLTAEHGILVRLREVRERLGSFGFADAVELACVVRRLEECRDRQPFDAKWTVDDEAKRSFWKEVRQVSEMLENLLVKEPREVRRERTGSVSARIVDRTGSSVRFSSSRWLNV
ncbi:Putative clathrin assembly protein [Apostasia shenzhenica]|uniref:Clathrin assembly protein n=1 Tax=Apostasia shenzhenica TaxID=1088818 RepID=A0A2I0AKQ7_9ASPA|nr:Putative clathrin assembly protein [Apostasia shenzhenica]